MVLNRIDPKPTSLFWIIATIAIAGGSTAYLFWQFQGAQSAHPSSEIQAPLVRTVTALGRLEPRGEVVQVSAPTATTGNRIAELYVQEGDRVEVGQVIAVLDNRDRLEAALSEAQGQLRIAEANLAKVQAGAATGEIQAQEAAIARIEAERQTNIAAQTATVARLEAQLRNAQVDYQRYQMLYSEGAIAATLRDSKQLERDTAQQHLQEAKATLERIQSAQQQQLNEARATLDRIVEVRPVDLDVAAAEVTRAQAAVKRAEADLAQAYIKAPQAGQILKIHTRPGELVGNDGIVAIGQTQQMMVIAEVYESDIYKVTPGQTVEITSEALPDQLQGTVEQVGLQVERQTVVNTDPTANIDARVVEVRIQLDKASAAKVQGLTNLQVIATITTES